MVADRLHRPHRRHRRDDTAHTVGEHGASTRRRRRTARWYRHAAAVGLGACLAIVAPVAAQVAAPGRAAPTETARFTLRSDARVGLHHFLMVWAAADAGQWPPYAEPIVERQAVPPMPPDARALWDAAVAAYGATVGRSPVFDDGLIAVRDWAAGATARVDVPAADRPLVDALERALPVYTRHWWPAHDARNRRWIEAVVPLARAAEAETSRRIAATYGGAWPTQRIPIDVVAYANDVGAYSTGGRVVAASGDPAIQGPQSLELLFHESSHTGALERPLRAHISAAFAQEGGSPPDRLWHDVIFFVSGEATSLALEAAGQPGYRHYGETAGVYARGERWKTELPAFEQHLRPLVRQAAPDQAARAAAFRAIARVLLR